MDPIEELIQGLWAMKGERTITSLARQAGLETTTMWRIMHRERRPNADSITALTRAFPALAGVFAPADSPNGNDAIPDGIASGE